MNKYSILHSFIWKYKTVPVVIKGVTIEANVIGMSPTYVALDLNDGSKVKCYEYSEIEIPI